MRVGLIGAGAIARRAHVPALRAAGADLVAVAGGRGTSASQLAGEHGLALEADWRQLVERPDIDAVVICSPNALHAEQASAAVAAGRHVLVEKPMTTTCADADRLVDLASSESPVVMVAHNARFAPMVVEAREMTRVTSSPVTSLRLALRGGGPRVWAPGSEWFFDPAIAGGGVLLDLGVHLLDAARHVLDDELEVISSVVQREDGIDVEAEVQLLSRRGVQVVVSVSWRAPAPGFELVLTSGAGELDVRPNLAVPADTPQAAFVRAVMSGRSAAPTVHDGRAAVQLALAAYEQAT